jgi:hypothetical protein
VTRQARVLVIIACGSAKVWDRHPDEGPTAARQAYIGAPFKVHRAYAERFGDAWMILSAKYGFLRPDDLVAGPYNVTFKRRSSRPIDPASLHRQIREQGLDHFDQVIVLGGADYRARVKDAFASTSVQLHFPFAGLPLGQSLQAAKEAVSFGRPLG